MPDANGDVTFPEAAALVIEVTTKLATLMGQLNAWVSGSPDGGPGGDGRYPFLQPDNTTIFVPCPASIEQTRLAQTDRELRRLAVQELQGAGPYTLVDAQHGGKRLRIGNGENSNLILVNLAPEQPVGTVFLVRQTGAAPVKFVVSSGSKLYHRFGHNSTGGRDAAVALTYEGAGAWIIDGDTAVLS